MSTAPAYRTSPIRRRRRRSHDDLAELLAGVQEILEAQDEQITIRHLFYLAVSAGLIEKTERGYQNLTHLLGRWRRAKLIAWDAFVDSTRWYYRIDTHDNLEAALQNTVTAYRRNLWQTQGAYVEVWVEKDAIASILLREASTFGVPVFPCRGYPSLSSLSTAAETFAAKRAEGRSCWVYYFGDHDPTGVQIDTKASKTLTDDFGVEVVFTRLAVTREQIREYNLPTRPTKKTDTRSKGFVGESVDIDAMPPEILRELVRDCITGHIDRETWRKQEEIEKAERQSAEKFLGRFRRGGRS